MARPDRLIPLPPPLPPTCTLADQANSLAMGRMAMLMQMRSMLHSMSVTAVGRTTVRKGLPAGAAAEGLPRAGEEARAELAITGLASRQAKH